MSLNGQKHFANSLMDLRKTSSRAAPGLVRWQEPMSHLSEAASRIRSTVASNGQGSMVIRTTTLKSRGAGVGTKG